MSEIFQILIRAFSDVVMSRGKLAIVGLGHQLLLLKDEWQSVVWIRAKWLHRHLIITTLIAALGHLWRR